MQTVVGSRSFVCGEKFSRTSLIWWMNGMRSSLEGVVTVDETMMKHYASPLNRVAWIKVMERPRTLKLLSLLCLPGEKSQTVFFQNEWQVCSANNKTVTAPSNYLVLKQQVKQGFLSRSNTMPPPSVWLANFFRMFAFVRAAESYESKQQVWSGKWL